MGPVRRNRLILGTVLFLGTVITGALGGRGGDAGWQRGAPLPEARSEVAAAVLNGQPVVAGGFRADGSSSPRVDAYRPATDEWSRLPDLPSGVHHAMAASAAGKLYVLGGYNESRRRLRTAFVLDGKTWRRLPSLPEPRAAGGAAIVAGKLYVVGGVAAETLARTMLVLDLRTRRWTKLPGPAPREHLAVAAAGGAVHALGGRKAGIDTNLDAFELYEPKIRRWRRLPAVPGPRGGTGAAALGGRIFSVGGEEVAGTIGSVYAYRVASGRWEPLPGLPTPRHGLGVVATGARLYAIAGGPQPGLYVSDATEYLELG